MAIEWLDYTEAAALAQMQGRRKGSWTEDCRPESGRPPEAEMGEGKKDPNQRPRARFTRLGIFGGAKALAAPRLLSKDTSLKTKKAPVWALLSSGGWIRTNDLRVMSFNPISLTLARRATRLGGPGDIRFSRAWRDWMTQSIRHCLPGLYSFRSDWQARCQTQMLAETSVHLILERMFVFGQHRESLP